MTIYDVLACCALAVSLIAFVIGMVALGAAHRSGTAEVSPSTVSPKPAVPVLLSDDLEYSRLDHLDGLPRRGSSSLEQDDR